MADTSGEKKNLYAYRMGTNDGEIKFGHVTGENQISACLLRSGFFHNHYITLDGTGERHRAGGTMCRSPGSFQVKAGDKCGPEDQTIMMRAENGDILLSAPTGKIILDAANILIRTSGGDGSGIIEIDASDKVNITGKGDGVKIEGTAYCKMVSEKTVEVIGGTVCNIYGGVIDMADGNVVAINSKPSKTGIKAESLTSAIPGSAGFVKNALGKALQRIGSTGNLETKMSSYGSLFK